MGVFVRIRVIACALLAIPAALSAGIAGSAEVFDIGLAASGQRIDALAVAGTGTPATRTVVLVGGLHGEDQSVAAVRAAAAAYESRRERPFQLLAVPLANPDGNALQFPPQGNAYREQAESHTLWRWLGANAPDLVLIAGSDEAGLAAALGANSVADMGRIPARPLEGGPNWGTGLLVPFPMSEAHAELERRRARSPRQLAVQLAQHYGRDFEQPWYIGAIALIGRLRLGELEEVRKLAEPWVDGTKDSLARPNALVMAGHILFTELARRTRDPRHGALVRRVADLGFDASGQMLEAMPYHDGYSDSVFMGTAILAQAGALTGEKKYFEMADRHLRFMEQLDLRPDGLYRHRPEADVAWGRGNGFAALGLALTLSELPAGSDAHAHALGSYRRLMATLLPLQTRDGLWRNVVNHPGAFQEFSGTAMIGFALQRGLTRGWIQGRDWEQAVAKAWLAVNSRSSATGSLIDVCESTARLTTLEQYLQRTAILGQDPRGGAMAMLFATELMED
jgi:rhamnogalacturonyl hydrolase YesR